MNKQERAEAFKSTFYAKLEKRNKNGYDARNFGLALMDTAKQFRDEYGYNEAIAIAKTANYAIELKGFRTRLPKAIKTVDEGKTFLTELYKNGEAYHPEDDARAIDWNLPAHQLPNKQQCKQLNKLMNDIYKLPGNENHMKMALDPCSIILKLHNKN